MKREYSILVYKTNKPFKPDVMYHLMKNECKICFDGFDSALYCCRLAFDAKYRRRNAADFLKYYEYTFVLPEYDLKIGGGV